MTPKRVLGTYFTIAGLYTLAAALIWGVNTLFLLDAGLDLFQVFIANAAFTAGSVLFEIPTGVLADSSGRRVSFLLSVSILLLTTLAYVGVAELGGGLIWFSSVSVLMGLGIHLLFRRRRGMARRCASRDWLSRFTSIEYLRAGQ